MSPWGYEEPGPRGRQERTPPDRAGGPGRGGGRGGRDGLGRSQHGLGGHDRAFPSLHRLGREIGILDDTRRLQQLLVERLVEVMEVENSALYWLDADRREYELIQQRGLDGDRARPRARSLTAALSRIVRGRAINPRFIAGMMRHGPRGAAELAETADRLVAFAETTGAVPSALFDLLHDAYLADPNVRAVMDAFPDAELESFSTRGP